MSDVGSDRAAAALPDDDGETTATFVVESDDAGARLDRFLAERLAPLSRSAVQRLIREEQVFVDGQTERPSRVLVGRERIDVVLPEPTPTELVAEDIPLSVLYQDDDLVVIDKPAGLVVHPAPGHQRGTLVNALLFHFPDIVTGGAQRPGIVHRLDKDTSGVMVIARSERGLESLSGQLARGEMEKRYVALVSGRVEEQAGEIDAPIARSARDRLRMDVSPHGRPALTEFSVVERFEHATLLDVQIHTGRTHQIRVHLRFIGHPIVGDALYNPRRGRFGGRDAIVQRQFLHATRLTFAMPGTGERRSFSAPLPADLAEALDALRRAEGSAA